MASSDRPTIRRSKTDRPNAGSCDGARGEGRSSALVRDRVRFGPLLALLVGLWVFGVAAPNAARADDHDSRRAAHPARIAAYILHPVGVVLDWLIVRPAHWVVEREPFRTLFGHESN